MRFKLKFKLLLAALSVFAIAAIEPALVPVAQAQKAQVMKLNPEQRASFAKLNAYINSFQSMQGKFVQISPRGQQTTGKVMISKPGKMRFEYDNPSPLLIVADGTWLTITTKKMDRGDQFPLSATPLRLVVSNKIDLLAETNVLGFEQAEGITSIALQDRKSKVGGYITLIFDETNNVLQQWIVTDGKGRKTTVQLADLETGVEFNPKLFKAKITRPEKNN
jgi:outer membrane lipoprotein-sorting protein